VLASVHGSAAGAGLSLAFVADLCIAAEDAASPPPMQARRIARWWPAPVGVAASVGGAPRLCKIFLAEDSFSAAQPLAGAWSPRSCPRWN